MCGEKRIKAWEKEMTELATSINVSAEDSAEILSE